MDPRAAFDEVLDLYGDAPASARAHLKGRWRICPFPRIEDAVPKRGRVLDFGCGHGLFAAYLAVTSPEREVLGIDVDTDKLEIARAAAARAAERGLDLTFDVVDSDKIPTGPFDAAVILDVLYLMPVELQLRTIAELADRIAPGGVLAIKEMGHAPRWKFHWNRFQETLAVHLFDITHGNEMHFPAPETYVDAMTQAGLEASEMELHRGYIHPHHMVVGRRAV